MSVNVGIIHNLHFDMFILKKEKYEFLERIKKLELYDDEEVPFYNVLLLGMVSHGKTSVVNSMASAIIGNVTVLTPAGSTGGGTGESMTREVIRLRSCFQHCYNI